jgi:hypothetical protein
LELPGDEIGISDILNYRECAQRFAWSMRRHDKTDLVPELDSAANAYGSVFHDAVEYVERDFMDDEAAIDAAWPSWQAWLTPEDLDRLKSRPSGVPVAHDDWLPPPWHRAGVTLPAITPGR